MTDPAERGDERDLAGFGYAQSLDRTLGGFSSFAAGFAFISILTGLFQMFHLGYGAVGPAFFWTWPAVALGQMTVAVCFAELSSHYPLCGSLYQWGARVGSPAVGWMAGWISLAGTIVSLAAVSTALQAVLPAIHPVFQIVGKLDDPRDSARNAVLLGCGLIAVTTFLNVRGVKLLTTINNLGVTTELVGSVAVIIALLLHARRGPSILLQIQRDAPNAQPTAAQGFLLAAITASYVMYGFETAGSLAEETISPRTRSPRAILRALSAAAVLGAILIASAVMATVDPSDPRLGRSEGGLTAIVADATGPALRVPLLIAVAAAIVSCALTVHTGGVRLLFAMARDGGVPKAERLSRVGSTSKTPTWPAIVVGLLAALILVANTNDPKVVEVVAAVSVVWINLSYLVVTTTLLVRRLQGWPGPDPPEGSYHLGRWGLAVNFLAVIWGVFITVNSGWPRPEVYGAAGFSPYAAPIGTTGLILLGGLYYNLARKRAAGRAAERGPRP